MTLDYRMLSDPDLLASAAHLAAHERDTTADLIRALGEIDLRRLYLGEGFSSLFTFCTGALHLSEHAAYARIEAARVARRFPTALDLLRDGSVNLTTLGLVAPHLTDENAADVLAAIVRKSKREVEQIVAARAPKPAVPSTLRPVAACPCSDAATASDTQLFAEQTGAARAPDGNEALPVSQAVAARAVVAPLAADQYKLQITLSHTGHEALRALQDLLRHGLPTGDPARIVDRALMELLERVRREKCGANAAPRRRTPQTGSHSRHIPATVRRTVWTRDEGRCAFFGSTGRCSERAFLEFHHVVPFADGGAATEDNIQLRCRAHNLFEADEWDLSAPS
jgi:hypothetical protein